jgi:transposase
MRFVAVKTEEQPARAMLFRTRDLLVRQRTQLINALRGQLSEHGVVTPEGPANVAILAQAIDDMTASLPLLVVELARVYLDQIDRLSETVARLEKAIACEAKRGAMTRRPADNAGRWADYSHGDRDLRAASGGIPPGARFRSLARAGPRATLDWRQAGSRENFQNGAARYSSAVNHRAMVIVRWACRKGVREGTCLHRMLGRKPRMLVAIALANKMARSIWAMLTKGEDYRVPVAAAF